MQVADLIRSSSVNIKYRWFDRRTGEEIKPDKLSRRERFGMRNKAIYMIYPSKDENYTLDVYLY